MSVCSYFAFFFMCGYKLRQSQAVLKRLDDLSLLKLGVKDDLDQIGQKDNNKKLLLEEALADYELRMYFCIRDKSGARLGFNT